MAEERGRGLERHSVCGVLDLLPADPGGLQDDPDTGLCVCVRVCVGTSKMPHL